MTAYVDGLGRRVILGDFIKKGGEGSVHTDANDPALVVKIYSKPDDKHAAKLRALCEPRYRHLDQYCAWPRTTVHDGPGGPIIGFTMHRVQGHEHVYRLCHEKERSDAFPNARWDFLVHVAGNVAALVDELHRHDVIVGDLNHQNLLVCPKTGTVTAIDCDSMQITWNGQTFHCDVGFEEYLCPELHGFDLSKTIRTRDHDAFALAILVFQLLMFGRHPFAGRYSGPGKYPSDKFGELIRHGLYAYGPKARLRHMAPPPNLISAELLTDRILTLFERAFTTRDHRPGASEWHTALNWLKGTLKTCNVERRHIFPRAVADCPFCAFEQQPNGRALFPGLPVVGRPPPPPADAFDIAAFERHIAAIQGPGPAPPLPQARLMQPSVEAAAVATKLKSIKRWGRVRARSGWAVFAAFAALAVVTHFPLLFFAGIGAGLWTGIGGWPFASRGEVSETVAPFRQRERQASRHLDTVRQQWFREASEERFVEARSSIQRAIAQWRDLAQERQRRLDRLRRELREAQQGKFLARFRIEVAEIRGIGRGRRIMLASYGIDTAADITRQSVAAVPGFGPALTKALLDWQTQCRSRFVFDPTAPVDPAEVAKVDADIARQRAELQQQMLRSASDLPRLAQMIASARNVLRPTVEAALGQQAQAWTDVRYLDQVFK